MSKINWREKIEEFDGLKHLYRHKTYNKYNEYLNDYDSNFPNIHYIEENIELKYNKTYNYSLDYLTFEALQDTTFKFTTNALQYSLDNGTTWTTLTAGTDSPTVTAGNKIMWKQTGLTPTSSAGIGTFSSTGQFNVQGNIMSLYYGDNFKGQTSLSGKNYAFYTLFNNCANLISCQNLILPATTLENYCYYCMFNNCKNLIIALELPATMLANYCYKAMFRYCTSLTTAPALPATTLATYCYDYMFTGCTSLTVAPELPATTLAEECYGYMFSGCTSLTTAPELPATTLANNCYYDMFYDCTSLTSAPKLPATTLAYQCYDAMFYNCINLKVAPELPATILASDCYKFMFMGCKSLNAAPELPAATLVIYCYYCMFKNCTKINSITCLATKISASNCTNNWVQNVASTGTFVKAASMNDWPTGTSGIPSGWTVQNVA